MKGSNERSRLVACKTVVGEGNRMMSTNFKKQGRKLKSFDLWSDTSYPGGRGEDKRIDLK